MKKKTVLFEDMYDTDISNFSTTSDVTTFLEEKLNRKLNIIPN